MKLIPGELKHMERSKKTRTQRYLEVANMDNSTSYLVRTVSVERWEEKAKLRFSANERRE